MPSLFVYGTLAPGRANAHILADLDGEWQTGSVKADLYESGWGAAMGYPGLQLNPEASPVAGYLFSSDALPDHWERIDAFEGEGYQRVICEVRLESGDTVSAFVYALRDPDRISA